MRWYHYLSWFFGGVFIGLGFGLFSYFLAGTFGRLHGGLL